MPPRLRGDERADVCERSRVEDVARLDPPAPRRDEAEVHLAAEHLGAMAVAADDDGGAGGDRAPRQRAVEVEMRRRPVDLQRGPGLDREREQPIVVERVAAPVTARGGCSGA